MKNKATAPAVPISVGQALLRYLKLEGVSHVFGIPGGGLANLLVEFKNQREHLHYVVCRHETGAAYAADGYARATGGLGVVAVTSGPGATNALTGAMNADNDGTPLLTITGEVDQKYFGKGYLQEGADARLDVDAVFTAATDLSVGISLAANAPELIEEALRVARGTPGRSAHIGLPDNVTVETLDAALVPTDTRSYRAAAHGIDGDSVRRIVETLSRARRPLLFLGNGCRRALADPATAAALREFVERYQIPVMTTADGKGIFPESHALSLRVYGFASCKWPYYWLNAAELDPGAAPYDALLIVGSALGGLATCNWHPMLTPQSGQVMQVDLDARTLGRGIALELGVVGEAGALFRALPAAAAGLRWNKAEISARKRFLANMKERHSPFDAPAEYASQASPIQPAALVRVLQDTLPKDALLFLDSGNCVGWGGHYFAIDPPRAIHSSLAMGPMGFAVGAVLGAKLGCPQRCCVALVGDGAFLMHGSEVSTAQAYGIGAIWVVLQDDDLHMVSQGMAVRYAKQPDPQAYNELYRLGQPDLVKVAEGLGAEAHGIDSPAQLVALMPKLLAGAAQGRPQVVVAHIARAPLPPYYTKDYAPPQPKATAKTTTRPRARRAR